MGVLDGAATLSPLAVPGGGVASPPTVLAMEPPARPPVPVVPVRGIWNPPTHPPQGFPGRNTNKLSILRNNLMKAMMKHQVQCAVNVHCWSNFVDFVMLQHSWPFLTPVDTVKLNLPDYFEIIKKPMDLGSIKRRLDHNYYWSADEAIEDFKQMFTNCYIYNKPGEDIVVMAKSLEKFFIAKMKNLPPEEFVVDSDGQKAKPKPKLVKTQHGSFVPNTVTPSLLPKTAPPPVQTTQPPIVQVGMANVKLR